MLSGGKIIVKYPVCQLVVCVSRGRTASRGGTDESMRATIVDDDRGARATYAPLDHRQFYRARFRYRSVLAPGDIIIQRMLAVP